MQNQAHCDLSDVCVLAQVLCRDLLTVSTMDGYMTSRIVSPVLLCQINDLINLRLVWKHFGNKLNVLVLQKRGYVLCI